MTQYEQGYTGTNGHRAIDHDELARAWIAELRQGKLVTPPPGKWYSVMNNLLFIRKEYGQEALEGTIQSYAQNTKSYPGFAALLQPKEQPPPARDEEEQPSIPPLPVSAQLSEDASMGASPWLDEYIRYSRRTSPEGYDGFHEACGLWVLSTVAGRRVKIPLRKKQYTPLMLLLVATTSLYAKSETAEVAINVLQAAGLRWMLGSDETTPQKLHSDMVGTVPKDYSSLSKEKQEKIKRRLAMSGQRGWFYDEFGQLIRSMLKANGVMAELQGLLLKLDKCADEYSYATQSRGTETVDKPYLALLGCMTPPDIKREAKTGGPFWSTGLWARFSFICPPPDTYIDAPFEIGEIPVPYELSSQLSTWHYRLGMPHIGIDIKFDEKGRETGTFDVEKDPLSETECQFGEGVWEAWARYRTALKQMIAAMKNRDLAGSYSRLAIRAMRVAALLASLESNGIIEMKHWARAQEIAEGWRKSLHELYVQVNVALDEPTSAKRIEDQIVQYVRKLTALKEPPTARDLSRYLTNVDMGRIKDVLLALVHGKVLAEQKTSRAIRYIMAEQSEESAQQEQTQEAPF